MGIFMLQIYEIFRNKQGFFSYFFNKFVVLPCFNKL